MGLSANRSDHVSQTNPTQLVLMTHFIFVKLCYLELT